MKQQRDGPYSMKKEFMTNGVWFVVRGPVPLGKDRWSEGETMIHGFLCEMQAEQMCELLNAAWQVGQRMAAHRPRGAKVGAA